MVSMELSRMHCMDWCMRISLQYLSDNVKLNDTIMAKLVNDLNDLRRKQLEDLANKQDLLNHSELNSVDRVCPSMADLAIYDIVLITLHKLLTKYHVFIHHDPSKTKLLPSKYEIPRQMFEILTTTVVQYTSAVRAMSEKTEFAQIKSHWGPQSLSQKCLSIIQSCSMYLSGPHDEIKHKSIDQIRITSQPEELRMSVLRGLIEIFGLLEFASDSNCDWDQRQVSMLAFLISQILELAVSDPCREVRQLSLSMLISLVKTLSKAKLPVLQAALDSSSTTSTFLQQILPGLALGLWKAIQVPKQSSRAISLALRCFSISIKAALSDVGNPCIFSNSQLKEAGEVKKFLTNMQKSSSRGFVYDALAAHNEEPLDWISEAHAKLDLLLMRIFSSFSDRGSWRVKISIIHLCEDILLHCQAFFHSSLIRILEELLIRQTDSNPEVARTAMEAAEKVMQSLDLRTQFLPEIQERLSMHISAIRFRSGTELEKCPLREIKLIIGYVRGFRPQLSMVANELMPSIYESFSRSFMLSNIDAALVVHRNLYRISNLGAAESLVISEFQKRFQHFHDDVSIDFICLMLRSIGSISEPARFIDCALIELEGDLQDTQAQQDDGTDAYAEVLFMLNEFMRSYTKAFESNESHGQSDRIHLHLVRRLIEALIELNIWQQNEDSGTSMGSSPTRHHSIAATHRRSMAVSLMVECIGTCVEVLEFKFNDLLLETLYPLVEKLGSSCVLVQQVALTSITKIVFFCGYSSIENLFEVNMDYFVDSLSIRMRHLDRFPNTSLVMKALLQHVHMQHQALVSEISECLLLSVDVYQDTEHTPHLLHALLLMLENISTEKPKESEDTEATRPISSEPRYPRLAKFLQEFNSLQINEEVTELDTDSLVDDVADQTKACMPVEHDERHLDDESQCPSEAHEYQVLTVRMLERCGYFLSTDDPVACCVVLKIIETGLRYLLNAEKVLLPLIHRLWPSIVHRLDSSNSPIVTATISLISVIAQLSHDFIGVKFVEQAWPKYKLILDTIQKETRKLSQPLLTVEQGNEVHAPVLAQVSATRTTQENRLLSALLKCLAQLCTSSPSMTCLVDEIAKSCIPFLSSRRSVEIQEKACQLFHRLAECNGDLIFVQLCVLIRWHPEQYCLPETDWPHNIDLTSIMRYYESESPRNITNLKDYETNAQKVLAHLSKSSF